MSWFGPDPEGLARRGDVAGLAALLSHRDRAVRDRAVRALADLADPRADAAALAALAGGAVEAGRVLALRDATALAPDLGALLVDEGPVAQTALGLLVRFQATAALEAAVARGGAGAALARRGLGRVRPPEPPARPAWPAILAGLSSSDADARWRAALSALDAGPPPAGLADAACQALIAALDPADPARTEPAARALARVDPARAIPPLLQALAAGHWGAARALGELGDRAAVPALVAALRDPRVDGVAAEALGALGDASALPALEAFVAGYRSVPRPGSEPDAADLARAAIRRLRAAGP